MNTNSATNKVVTGTVFTEIKDTGVTVPVTVNGTTTAKPIHLRQATGQYRIVFGVRITPL